MEEQPTCGKGLAEHSVLPAKVAELIALLAENLEIHMRALDPTDWNSRIEHDAYARLAEEYRAIAAMLKSTADQMAGYRDLPMGRHDEKAMADPEVFTAFEKFLTVKRELLDLLQKGAKRDREMLASMRR